MSSVDILTEADPDTIETLADLKAALRRPLPEYFPFQTLRRRLGKPRPVLRKTGGHEAYDHSSGRSGERDPRLRSWESAWHRAWSRKSQSRSQRKRVFWRALVLGIPATPALVGLTVNRWTSARHFGVGNWIAFAATTLLCLFVGFGVKSEYLELGGYTRLAPICVEYEGWFVKSCLPRIMPPLSLDPPSQF